MDVTLILLAVIGIGIYFYLKRKRKTEVKRLDDHFERGIYNGIKETKRLGKEWNSNFRRNKYNIYYRKYSYSDLNINTLDYLLKQKCSESYNCVTDNLEINIYRIRDGGTPIELYRAYKLKMNPFNKYMNLEKKGEINTFSYIRNIPDKEFYKFEESLDVIFNQCEKIEINCLLGYKKKSTRSGGYIKEIYILYFEEVKRGEIQSGYGN